MQKSIGAFWKKISVKGTNYMSGNIEINGKKIQLVVFENKKEKENQPDYKIYLSEKNE